MSRAFAGTPGQRAGSGQSYLLVTIWAVARYEITLQRRSGAANTGEGAARARTAAIHEDLRRQGVDFSQLPDPVEELTKARDDGYRDL